MKNDQNIYRVSPGIAIAIILQLIFMVFAFVAIFNILNYNVGNPKIEISNYSIIPDGKIISKYSAASNAQDIKFALNDNDKRTIENAIYDAVLVNNTGSIVNSGARIREDSAYYAYIEGLNVYFLNFIVDIENLQQSYRFAWLWGGDSSDQLLPEVTLLMAFCPSEDEMIYDNFNCRDDYNGRGSDIVAYNLLRYKLFSDFTVGLNDVYSGKPLDISINVGFGDDSARVSAIEEVSQYLTELGFNLDDFKYNTDFLEVAK